MATLDQNRVRQIVTFRLADDLYGIDIFRVNEIIRWRDVTSVPKSDPSLLGLINLRGKPIPVIDLRSRFGLTESNPDGKTRIVIAESQNETLGLKVDEVLEVTSVPEDHIEPASALHSDVSVEYIVGVAQFRNGLLTLIDLERSLAA